jgi:hypothetical protein
MVCCPVTYYKCPLAQFCRFFFTHPTQSSCGRNSVSATSLVREFSCGRCRREQQSSTGDPQPRLEFGRVPPPARCRALSSRRFRSSLLRDEGLCGEAARLPILLLHRGELCCRPPQSPLGARDVRKKTPLAVGCRKSRARRSKRVDPARSDRAVIAKFLVPQFAARAIT